MNITLLIAIAALVLPLALIIFWLMFNALGASVYSEPRRLKREILHAHGTREESVTEQEEDSRDWFGWIPRPSGAGLSQTIMVILLLVVIVVIAVLAWPSIEKLTAWRPVLEPVAQAPSPIVPATYEPPPTATAPPIQHLDSAVVGEACLKAKGLPINGELLQTDWPKIVMPAMSTGRYSRLVPIPCPGTHLAVTRSGYEMWMRYKDRSIPDCLWNVPGAVCPTTKVKGVYFRDTTDCAYPRHVEWYAYEAD